MFRGRRDLYQRPLVEYSAICLTGADTAPKLLVIRVGPYQDDQALRRDIDNRKPPAVLRPYTVLSVIATALADDAIEKMSKTRRIPIAKE